MGCQPGLKWRPTSLLKCMNEFLLLLWSSYPRSLLHSIVHRWDENQTAGPVQRRDQPKSTFKGNLSGCSVHVLYNSPLWYGLFAQCSSAHTHKRFVLLRCTSFSTRVAQYGRGMCVGTSSCLLPADNTVIDSVTILYLVLPPFCTWLQMVDPRKPWQNRKVDSSKSEVCPPQL